MKNMDSIRDKWQVISGILAATMLFLILFNVTINPRFIDFERGVTDAASIIQPEAAPAGNQMVGGC